VETLNGIVRAFGGRSKVECKEDVLIREQDFGNFDKDNMKDVHKEKKQFGKFYFRFPDGESPADVYLRAGIFLESLYRRWETNYVENCVIVSHELFIVTFLMRMFRFPVQEYYSLDSVPNCSLVVLERPADALKYDFAFTQKPGGERVPGGLKRLSPERCPVEYPTWDGDPANPPLHNDTSAFGRAKL
jgi:broad specificity phosphatase PhoE